MESFEYDKSDRKGPQWWYNKDNENRNFNIAMTVILAVILIAAVVMVVYGRPYITAEIARYRQDQVISDMLTEPPVKQLQVVPVPGTGMRMCVDGNSKTAGPYYTGTDEIPPAVVEGKTENGWILIQDSTKSFYGWVPLTDVRNEAGSPVGVEELESISLQDASCSSEELAQIPTEVPAVELQPLPAEAPAVYEMVGCIEVGSNGKWGDNMEPFAGTQLICGEDKFWDITRMFYNGAEYLVPETTNAKVAPEVLATEAPIVAQECSLKDGGLILALQQSGEHWVLNPSTLQVLDDAGNYVDRPDLSGCNLITQGQKDPSEEVGHIWILRDVFSTKSYNVSYLETDGTFICSNCSAWVFPTTWNMETWDAPEGEPVAGMYLTDLRKNMQENVNTPHDWPITIHYTDGTSKTWEPGETAGVETGATCNGLESPERVKVTGIVGDGYVGSLGETGCWNVAWVDGSSEPKVWEGAYDNFEIKKEVVYFLMPWGWDEKMTKEWADAHSP